MNRPIFVLAGLIFLGLTVQGRSATPMPAQAITTYKDPAFQKWAKETAALPADKQAEAVIDKLKELNPEFFFDRRCCRYKIDGGGVTEFKFYADYTADISPVRVFDKLRVLTCFGTGDGQHPSRCKLSDLSPLKGMTIERLSCSGTEVVDLSPLKEIKLESLDCSSTRVTDLTPLKGLTLSHLDCNWSQVTDLSPLRGMPLVKLGCTGTEVSDLSPLKGMPLAELDCDYTIVANLLPLADCKSLSFVQVKFTKVTPATVAALQKALPKCDIDWTKPAEVKTPDLK